MTRILYALPSVGMGHVVRAKVIIEELQKKHQVFIITSAKSYEYLKEYYPTIQEIPGLEISIKNNKVHVMRTLLQNSKKCTKKNYQKIREAYKKVQAFKPQIVISDFETISAYIARRLKIPLLELDNQKYLTQGEYMIPFSKIPSYLLARFVIWLITKKADAYMTLLRKGEEIEPEKNMYTLPPVIRKELCNAKNKQTNKILVYTATHTKETLLKILQKIKAEFIIYGYETTEKKGNIQFKKFNEKEFITDFTSAKAIITTGGFSVISEAITQAKPLLVIPIQHHFEQELNGRYVQEQGYGRCEKKLTTKVVQQFLQNLKKYTYTPVSCKNQEAFAIIEKVIKKYST